MGCRRDQHYFGQDLVLVDVVGTEDVILYKATDQGWHKLTSPQGTELRVTPDKTLYIFNAESHQIYRSTDVGENWSLIATAPVFTESQTATRGFYPTPLPDVFLLRVIHEPLGAAGQQGIYKSADGGTTWKKVLEGNGWDVAVSPSFAQDGIALASLRGYKLSFGIWKTTDWGETWQPSSNGLLVGTDLTGYNIAISPQFAQDETVFAASGIGVYKSIDGGNSWTMLLSPDDLSYLPHDLVLSPYYINDQSLLVWGEAQGSWNDPHALRLSRDGGQSWQTLVQATEGQKIVGGGLRYLGPFTQPPAPPIPGPYYVYLLWVSASGQVKFELWHADINYYDPTCYYYHSTDNGRTWAKLVVFEVTHWLYLPLVSRSIGN